MEKVALIYIGANTTRMVLWEITGDANYRIVQSVREPLRIAEDADLFHRISDSKFEEGIRCLKQLQDFAASQGTRSTYLLTSEVFDRLDNADLFLEAVRLHLGMEAIPLNGSEETHLDYLSVISSMRVNNALMVDISGASTGLAWIENGKLKASIALPVGTLNLTKRFKLESVVTKEDHVALEKHLDGLLQGIPWIGNAIFNDIILLGGSARSIAKIDRKKKRYPLQIIHNYPLEDVDIRSLYATIITKSLRQRYAVEGLDRDRADIILAALAIVQSILKNTAVQTLRVSGYGVREGFLIDYLERRFGKLPDMLDHSIRNLLTNHRMSLPHAQSRVALTDALFQALQPLHGIKGPVTDIIKVAASLRDIGLTVNLYNHYKHNFYIITNTELNGLSHKEILMAALVAAFHKSIPKELAIVQYGHIINRLDLLKVDRIGILLDIVDALDSTRTGKINALRVELAEDRVVLIPGSTHSLAYECSEVSRLKDAFQEIYGIPLEVLAECKSRN